MAKHAIFATILTITGTHALAQEEWAGVDVPDGNYTLIEDGRIVYEPKTKLIGNEWIEARCDNDVPSFLCDRNDANAAVALIPIDLFARSSTVQDIETEIELVSLGLLELGNSFGARISSIEEEINIFTDNRFLIGQNRKGIETNSTQISENEAAIATNRSDIDANRSDIDANSAVIQTNTAAIGANSNRISTNSAAIGVNSAQIARSMQDIDMLQQSMVGLDTRVTGLENQVGENRTGIAIAMAMSGGVGLQPGETFRVNANWGTWDGDSAFAVSGTYRASGRFMINAAAGSGADGDEFGGRAGISFGW